MKNYGVDIAREYAEQSNSDWKFGGGSVVSIAEVSLSEIEKYLPKGELQFGKEDFMDCVSRAFNNEIEKQLNWLWRNNKLPNVAWFIKEGFITENGFELSDRWVAMGSGTTRYGNSLKAPIHFIHKNGVIPKKILPKKEGMTFDEYHNTKDVTTEMFRIGEKFLEIITVEYDQVDKSFFPNMNHSIICALHGWPVPVNGEYPRTDAPFNHSVDVWPHYIAFDNYLDNGVQGDFIKKLSKDYKFFDYGYRVILSLTPPKKSWWETFSEIKESFKRLLLAFLPKEKAEETIKIIEEIKPIKTEYEEVKEAVKEKYLWDTPQKARHSCRVIMDEMGITHKKMIIGGKQYSMKDVLCATIKEESQFNPRAVGKKNTDGTQDFGLCQFNNGKNKQGVPFWIGVGAAFKDVDDVFNNPEKNVRILVTETLKHGYPKWWKAFTSGAFKRHL